MIDGDDFRKNKVTKDGKYIYPTTDEEFRDVLTDYLIGENSKIGDNLPRNIENTVIAQYVMDNLPYKIARSENTIWIPLRADIIVILFFLFMIGIILYFIF